MMMALKYRNGCPAKTHQSSQLASQSTETAMARPRLEKVTAGCNLEEFTVTSASDQSYVLSVLEVIALVFFTFHQLLFPGEEHFAWLCLVLAILFSCSFALQGTFCTKETLLIMHNTGLQLHGINSLGNSVYTKFIDREAISSIFICELCITTHSKSSDLEVVFKHVKPRLAELLPVYQALLQAFDNGSLGAAGEKQAGQ